MANQRVRRLPVLDSSVGRDPNARLRVEFPDGSAISLNRREFLRLGAATSAAATLAGATGCAPEQEAIRPRTYRPAEARVGQRLAYATTCQGCPAGCGVLAQVREGHVVKLEGNDQHPLNQGALCARGQAAVLDLYDPDRLRRSLAQSRGKKPALEVSADSFDQKVLEALKKVVGTPRVRLLTGALSGSAMQALVADFLSHFPGAKHVAWEPLGPLTDTVVEAQRRCHGRRIVPKYAFDRARLVVSLGSEFLDTWLSPLGQGRQFGSRRQPDAEQGMSRLWVFEGRMSLTGSNADRRFRVRTSQLPDVALGLAHVVLVEKQHGRLARDPKVVGPLRAHTPAAVSDRTGVPVEVLRQTAEALIRAAGESLVIAGGSGSTGQGGLCLEIVVNLLNAALGNDGATIDPVATSEQRADAYVRLQALTHELRNGKADVLIIHGSNPVYAAPPVLGFAEALTHVPTVICISDRVDETAWHADYVAAATQALESWSDAQPLRGLHAVSQPAMQPMGEMRSLGDLLARWASLLGSKSRLAAAQRATQAQGAVASGAYHFIREHWRRHIYPRTGGTRSFDEAWPDILQAGFLLTPSWQPERRTGPRPFNPYALSVLGTPRESAAGLELALFASHAHYDGRSGNNGWLFEYPDPVTRITWDAWVGLSPARMAELGLVDGDRCEVAAVGWRVWLPAVGVPGQHDDVVSIPVGFGRTRAGVVGDDIGPNAYVLTEMGPLGPQFAGQGVTVEKAKGRVQLAIPQGETTIDLSVRPLIPYATLSAVEQNPAAGTARPGGGASIWPTYAYDETRWGMAIDLSKCIGCGACTIACQAENNIPVAGRQGVIEGREMHWLRVDRYYRLPVEPAHATSAEERQQQTEARAQAQADPHVLANPEVIHHPLMCQHCENAPCETVCPVGATQHSEDGLNVQAYNRCVGTRYCANNCPFKARRFNWFDYSRSQDGLLARIFEPRLGRVAKLNSRWPLPLKNNPEVTVRSRGVMEKCTFCVQRIAAGRGKAKDEGRAIRDGDIVPACAQTCPTGAIRFGNLADAQSEVARLRRSPRGLTMLDEQKLGTSVTYLTKVRNDES
jgi:Fe-S-cluster-containing dehydrogenase component/anaerobic selenocysteine-containing dehydrogenase